LEARPPGKHRKFRAPIFRKIASISFSRFEPLSLSHQMDSRELGPHEWLLQDAIHHLPQALHDFRNQNVVDSRSICLSGACAVWIHALSHEVGSHREGHDSLLEDEVMRILKIMPIPTHNSVSPLPSTALDRRLTKTPLETALHLPRPRSRITRRRRAGSLVRPNKLSSHFLRIIAYMSCCRV
jgi:hypothetical protein